jgi:hypothetical protein
MLKLIKIDMGTTEDLSNCSLDELLTIRQNAIEAGNIELYRACGNAISVLYSKWESKGA